MGLTLSALYRAVSIFLYVVRTAILVYCVMSWFRPTNRFFDFLQRFIAPFVMPFRRLSQWIMARTGLPIDFSCVFAIIGLSLFDRLILWLFGLLARVG